MLHHWLFSTEVFMHYDYKHIFLLEFKWDFFIIHKTLCTPYFFHGIFEVIYIGRQLADDQIDMDRIRGSVTKHLCICDQLPDSYSQETHPLGEPCLNLYIKVHLCNKHSQQLFCLIHLSLKSLCHWVTTSLQAWISLELRIGGIWFYFIFGFGVTILQFVHPHCRQVRMTTSLKPEGINLTSVEQQTCNTY